jgi:hypothetical protein
VSTAAGGLRGAPLALGELSEKQRASLPALQVHAGLRVSCQPESVANLPSMCCFWICSIHCSFALGEPFVGMSCQGLWNPWNLRTVLEFLGIHPQEKDDMHRQST